MSEEETDAFATRRLTKSHIALTALALELYSTVLAPGEGPLDVELDLGVVCFLA